MAFGFDNFLDLVKQGWSTISGQPISEEAIRAVYSPPEDYRIYPNRYEAGESFRTTIGQPLVMYILDGRCKYKRGDREVTLQGSEFACLDRGSYFFEVLGSSRIRLVTVYKMPHIDEK